MRDCKNSKIQSRTSRRIISVLITAMLLLGLLPTLTAAASNVGVLFSYNSSEEVTITQSGWYYVEAWGGNGGSTTSLGRNIAGGVSQMESGYFHFSAGDTLYIQVGAAGEDGSNYSSSTGGSAGTGAVGDYFGSGFDGGNGGAGYSGRYISGLGGGGGGGGGAASGILLNGEDVSNIIIASGGGGGAGGNSLSVKSGGVGGASGQAGGITSVTSNNGAAWSADRTEGYDGGFIRHNGEDASITTLNGGGGAGGGGGGWDGSIGGGGQSGNGGKANIADSEAGGGGAGGQSANAGQTLPSSITAPSANARTTTADGQVNLTLLAETYSVTYSAPNATSGTVPTDTTDYLENDTVIVLGVSTLLRTGYDFAGWSDGTNVYQDGDDFEIASDTTLTAVWDPDYTDPYWLQVTYSAPNTTSGTAPTDPGNYIANGTVTVLGAGTLKKSGYSFVGWSNATTVYKAGDKFTITSDTTLTAVWEPDYTDSYWLQVTYSAPDAKSGSVPADPSNYIANGTVTVLGAGTLKRSGYSFVGWSDGTKTYKEGDQFVITSDTTLTAVWKKNASSNTSPQTGDNSNTWGWAIAGFASVMCIAVLYFRNKRTRLEK